MSTASATSGTQQVEPGIRGWLLVFILWLGVLSPVFWIGFNIVAMRRLEQANPDDAVLMREMNWDVLLWAVTLIREGLHIAAALMLYVRRTSTAVWFALAILWLSGPLLILGTWAVVDGEDHWRGLARSALVAGCWTLYLLMSGRVKATYNFRVAT
jgi:hypothetical protein